MEAPILGSSEYADGPFGKGTRVDRASAGTAAARQCRRGVRGLECDPGIAKGVQEIVSDPELFTVVLNRPSQSEHAPPVALWTGLKTLDWVSEIEAGTPPGSKSNT